MAVFSMELPPLLMDSGASTAQQVNELKSYLYRLTEQLQYSLSHIEEENIGESFRSRIVAANTAAVKIQDLSEAQRLELDEYLKRLNDTNRELEEIQAQRMYRIETITEGPSIMTDRGQTARLRCRVFSWDEDITASLPEAAFGWHRVSGNEAADQEWGELRGKGKKEITITTEDIVDNASFYCEVLI